MCVCLCVGVCVCVFVYRWTSACVHVRVCDGVEEKMVVEERKR